MPLAARGPRRGSCLGGLLAAALVALAATGLGLTNPTKDDFERFAAPRLLEAIEGEVCEGDALPPMVRMALPNCPELVQAQSGAIAALVGRHTRRWNLGLFSLYRSEAGGQQVLLWSVPRVRTTVLGIAGQFLVLHASLDDEEP